MVNSNLSMFFSHQFSMCEVHVFDVEQWLPEPAMLPVDVDVEHQQTQRSLGNTDYRNLKEIVARLEEPERKGFFNEIQSDLVKTTPTIETWKTIVARLEETELEMVFFNEIQVKVVCQKRESL